MPNILSLPALTTSTGNIVFPVVDVNVTPNTTKKATLSQIKDYIGATVIAPMGYTGSVGPIGYVGSIGVGYTGSASTAAGYAGSLGYVGSIGVGYDGSQGDIGYIGSQGDLGYTGSQGDIGYTGSQGQGLSAVGTVATSALLPAGYSGNPGDVYYVADSTHIWVWDGLIWVDNGKIQGDVGYTGSSGIGYAGSSGVIGYVGSASTAVGYTGSSGIGYAGSRGVIGYVGSASTAAGYAGSRGYYGSIGYIGSQGTTGYVGSNSGGIISEDVIINLSTVSVGTDTGALVVHGGVGIGGSVHIGGTLTANQPFILPSYTTATIVTAGTATGSMIFVSDAPGGAQPCYYDGANWYTVDSRTLIV